MKLAKPEQRDVLAAVRSAKPSHTGAVKISEVITALSALPRAAAAIITASVVDRTLQSLRRGGLLKYTGRRDAAGKVRKRWGWELAVAGRKV